MQLNISREHSSQARELRGMFEQQLKELYWAENVMVPMLDKTIGNTTSKDLSDALINHSSETGTHAKRLEKIFVAIGLEAKAERYEALACLMKEGENFIMNARKGVVRDAGIIAVLQKIKHYEIACYGTMRAYAIALKEEDVVALLEETLNEEKQADLILSGIAESHINVEAADKEI